LIDILTHSILSPMDHKAELLSILDDELRRHPGAGPEDVRKLIVQSVYGGDHLLRDEDAFRVGFLSEWAQIDIGRAVDGFPAIQPIDPSGRTARIHLAPCKERGIDASSLLELLIAQPWKEGSRSDFDWHWDLVLRLADEGRLPLSRASLERLAPLDGLPHHGPGYGFASYRILHDIAATETAACLAAWGLR
jgi:hypothetical protein